MRQIEKGAVYDQGGKIIGFRCSECGHVKDSMFGDICNGCRAAERRHQEMLKALNP